MSKWYDSGYDTEVKETFNDDDERVFRFWMPGGSEQEVTFVDDDTQPLILTIGEKEIPIHPPFIAEEYNFYLNGSWKNWFTKPSGADPFAFFGERSTQVAFYTIIDHREWTDRNGKVHKDEKKLLPVKTSTSVYKLLQKRSTRHGGLRGARFEVSRLGGDKSPSVGDSYDFVSKSELPPELQPFNYIKILKPCSLKTILNVCAQLGHDPSRFPVNGSQDQGNRSTHDTKSASTYSGYGDAGGYGKNQSLPPAPDDDDIPF